MDGTNIRREEDMIQESVTIILPLPVKVLQPNSTVATMGGRFMKARATKRYRSLAKACVLDELDWDDVMSGGVMWKKASVKTIFYHKTKRKRDEDNAKGSLKAAFDGVVDSGLIPDDDSEHLTHEKPEFKIDKRHQRVELTFTRME